MTRPVIRTTSRQPHPLRAQTSTAAQYGRVRLGPALAAVLLLITAPASTALAQSTEQRLDRLERLLESSTLLELADHNEKLRDEVQRLTGELDQAQRELRELHRQQRSLYEDVDSRLQALEQRDGDAPSDTPSPEADSAPTVPETPSLDNDVSGRIDRNDADAGHDEAGSSNAGADYQAAFELLRDGRYSDASEAFQKVLDEHPGTAEASNARYWLGESYYVVREFDAAMEQFEIVLDSPDHSKLSDAMLKIGYIQYERGAYGDAREFLESVRNDFPDTTEATLAENRLRRMNDEGR